MTNWQDEPSELDLVYEELLKAEDEIRILQNMIIALTRLHADAILENERLKRLIEEWNN